MSPHAPRDGSAAERSPIDFLVLGHVTVDRVDDERVAMGGTTYAALTARNMGARVGLHTSASYEPGLVDVLRGTYVARVPAEYTTCFTNEYRDGRRRQLIESVAEKLTYEQLLPEWRNPPVVHVSPLCQELDGGIVTRFPRSLIGVAPQGWLRGWDGPDGEVRPVAWSEAERVLARADAVVVSEHDVADRTLIDEWARRARLLVVTLGERGAAVYRRGGEQPYHAPAFRPAKEVDPTGAGDVFAAAYVWQLYQSRGNWRQAADWANCVASFAVEKRGVLGIPKLSEVEQRWAGGSRIDG
jgi:1D-myo-inositol 3-kinase